MTIIVVVALGMTNNRRWLAILGVLADAIHVAGNGRIIIGRIISDLFRSSVELSPGRNLSAPGPVAIMNFDFSAEAGNIDIGFDEIFRTPNGSHAAGSGNVESRRFGQF